MNVKPKNFSGDGPSTELIVPFYLRVDGANIWPFFRIGRSAAFIVPADTRHLTLISPTWSPADVDPSSEDDRRLGLRIEALTIGDPLGNWTQIALDDARLGEGFNGPEREGETLFRWTDGNATLPAALWADQREAFVLHLSGAFDKVWTTSQGDDPLRTILTADASGDVIRPNAALLSKPSAVPGSNMPFFLAVDDGRIIEPIARAHDKAAFVITPDMSSVRLVSQTWSPSDLDPTSADTRKLGLLIRGLSIENLVEPGVAIELDDEGLFDGFYKLEHGLQGSFRWTNGDAGLSSELWAKRKRAFVLRVEGQFENAATNPVDRELVLRFENLGADCEFGIVQRMLSAEPLGLLRWADVSFESLMDALEVRFEGLGTPDFTTVSRGEGGEFFVRDKRWGLDMHTFINDPAAQADKVLMRMRRHVIFLKEKLIADLQDATKIFMYKNDYVTDWQLRALHDSIGRIGPARLLHLKRSRDDKPYPTTFNSFVVLRPGLFSAQLTSKAKDSLDARIEDWLRVCRMAEQHCGPIENEPAAASAHRAAASASFHGHNGNGSRDSVFEIPHATSVFIERPRSGESDAVLRVNAQLPARTSRIADIDAKRDLIAAVKRAARHLGVKEHKIIWH